MSEERNHQTICHLLNKELPYRPLVHWLLERRAIIYNFTISPPHSKIEELWEDNLNFIHRVCTTCKLQCSPVIDFPHGDQMWPTKRELLFITLTLKRISYKCKLKAKKTLTSKILFFHDWSQILTARLKRLKWKLCHRLYCMIQSTFSFEECCQIHFVRYKRITTLSNDGMLSFHYRPVSTNDKKDYDLKRGSKMKINGDLLIMSMV